MAGVTQPTDQSHFILPDLGEGVHEAELLKWRVSVGDTIKEHETLADMETDKAVVEVPSPWTGVVAELCGAEGEIINVGNILVKYDIGGGSSAAPETQSEETAAAGKSDEGDADGDAGTVVGNVSGELTVSSRFARRTEEAEIGTNGTGRSLATPAVRRIARELGVDIGLVPGTGRGGRVTASDVHGFAGNGGTAAPATPSAAPVSAPAGFAPQSVPVPADLPPVDSSGVSEVVPFRGVRRKIAQALDQSVKTAVHFTVVDEANVTAIDAKRREYANVLGQKLSLLPFVMTAVCKALGRHPELNAIVDDGKSEILRKDGVNLGCAVDTEHGLMVPVIHGAHTLSIAQLGNAVSQLARGCKDRSIERERLQGGTFTISNVGSYGGMFATPIINYPEVAILAAGRAKERVLAEDGRMFVGKVLPLSLSCDHRVVDGAEGARFLNTVVKLLEDPDTLIG